MLTIDEIINPPGMLRGQSPAAINPRTIQVTNAELDSVNPNFMRFNHSQVVYTTEANEAHMSGSRGGSSKNVSFASSSATSMPSVR